MNVFAELNIHAMNDDEPTQDEYGRYHKETGLPFDTLYAIYHHLRMSEFYYEEAQFDSPSLNRARARTHRLKAARLFRGTE